MGVGLNLQIGTIQHFTGSVFTDVHHMHASVCADISMPILRVADNQLNAQTVKIRPLAICYSF